MVGAARFTGRLRGRRRALLVLACLLLAAVAGVAALGFGLAPRLLRDQAQAYVRQAWGRELTLGRIAVQPFALQLELRDIALPDADGQPMLGLQRLFVELDPASLWRGALVFRQLRLEAPRVRAVRRPDGRLNLADLAPPASDPRAADSAPPRLWIETLAVSGGELEWVDATHRPQALVRRLTAVALQVHDFRTTAEGGDFSFSARSPDDERLDWKGHAALAPALTSQGEIKLTGLRAAGLAEALGDALPLAVSGGTLDVLARYRVALGAQPAISIQVPQVALQGLALRARGADTDTLLVPSLVASDAALAWPERRGSLARLTLTDARLAAHIERDGQLDLLRLAMPTAPAAAGPAAPAWTFALAALELRNARLDFEDRQRAAGQPLVLAPLNLSVQGASQDLSRPLQVQLEATLNSQAALKASGPLTPQPLAAELELALQRLPLTLAQPYLAPFVALTLQSGQLSLQGRLQAAAGPPGATSPRIRLTGEAEVDDFRSIDSARREALLSFRRLALRGLRVDSASDGLRIERVTLTQPHARAVVEPERVLNVAALFKPRPPSSTTAQPAAKSTAATAWPVRVDEVRVEGGRLNFADLSVQPQFAAEIRDLQGQLSGLSSAPAATARLALKGRIDEFSPVDISGSLQPFAYDRFTDIGLSFRNISLPIFNPYSGRFAGYSINKGKLDTTLRYIVQDRQLKASHKLRIDQLEWGAATESKEAASLPVKFATALLRDKDGVIDLDLPVSGSLDDPQFRVGPLVWQIVKNLLAKAVTAPFALIGSLFAGAQEAQFVEFAPGSATLDAAAAEHLAQLAKALANKPGLVLDLPIGGVPEVDRPVLIERRWRQQLAAAIAVQLGRTAADRAPLPALDALPPAQQRAVLQRLLGPTGAAETALPQAAASAPRPAADAVPVQTASAATPASAAADDSHGVAPLLLQARSRIVVTEADLTQLGQARARAVQHALLTATGLDPERVFTNAAGKVSVDGGKVRFELALR
jgi:uncharacterized protein involved in outer membrane biogenesis